MEVSGAMLQRALVVAEHGIKMKAYLNVEDSGEGMFSSERILKARDYYGNVIEGFFDKSNIKEGKLEVSVLGEECDGVMVVTPQAFLERNTLLYFKREDLTYSL